MVCPCRLWTTQSHHSDGGSQSFPHFPPPHMNLPVRGCYTLYGSRCTSSWEKVQEVERIWQTPDTQMTFSHTEGENGVYSCIKMMIQGISKRLRVEVVATRMQVVVQVLLLPTCWKSEIHTKKFRFLALTLSHDAFAYRNAITMVLSRWGCPLWNFEDTGLLNSLTKLLQHHGGQDAEHFH